MNIVKEPVLTVVVILLMGLLSCEKIMPDELEESTILDGPMEGLSDQETRRFLQGDVAFGRVFTVNSGLGPLFVANQCASCHPGDGKGHPFVEFTRFGQSDTLGNTYLDRGGPQLQHKAIPGYTPETLPLGAASTRLIAPAVTGLGFLDAVSDQDLLDLADPDDLDGDGISGRVNYINAPNYITIRPNAITLKGKYIGRFGKKAAAYDLLHQTSGAYKEDMGVNSIYEPIDTWSKQEVDPEVSTDEVNAVVFYLKTLKAPIQRNPSESNIQAGKSTFQAIGCGSCHVPEMKTGESPIAALSNKVFYPYTDLLLHDMGPSLDDGYTEGSALTSEWRTPPLWGLGLSKDAQGGTYYLMHDGRATSIEQAILMHGGEGTQSSNAYRALSESEKKRLIEFLESL